MAGHLHSDQFRVFRPLDNLTHAILLAPSLSPVFYNNPMFRQLFFDDGVMANYLTYYLDLMLANINNKAAWYLEYDYCKAYGVCT